MLADCIPVKNTQCLSLFPKRFCKTIKAATSTQCVADSSYFSELMSMTKRYFTSCFNKRSKASLIVWIGITSTLEVML